jgi:hypothetical protein
MDHNEAKKKSNIYILIWIINLNHLFRLVIDVCQWNNKSKPKEKQNDGRKQNQKGNNFCMDLKVFQRQTYPSLLIFEFSKHMGV